VSSGLSTTSLPVLKQAVLGLHYCSYERHMGADFGYEAARQAEQIVEYEVHKKSAFRRCAVDLC